MQNLQSLGLVSLLLISLVGAAPVFADDDDEVKPPTVEVKAPTAPLTGRIEVQDSPAAPVAPPAPKKALQAPPAGALSAPVVHKAQVAAEQPIELHSLPMAQRANTNTNQLRAHASLDPNLMHAQWRYRRMMVAQATPNVDSVPYVWAQNIAGGYIDTSGHVKGSVSGDKLASYGGKFYDGTPVRRGPVSLNGHGHIRGPQLTPGFFVRNN